MRHTVPKRNRDKRDPSMYSCGWVLFLLSLVTGLGHSLDVTGALSHTSTPKPHSYRFLDVTDLLKASETEKSQFFSLPHFLSLNEYTKTYGRLIPRNFIIFYILNRREGLKKSQSALNTFFVWSSIRRLSLVIRVCSACGAEFQEPSAPDSLRAIGNPKMYKPTQHFFFFSFARVRNKRIVEGQIIDAARSFYIPAAADGHPSPWRLFWGPCHT